MSTGDWGRDLLDRLRAGLARAAGEPVMMTRTLRGIPVAVVNTRPDIDTEQVFRRLDGALGVIDRYQPWRLRHLQRDLSRIEVRRYPCRAAYFPATLSCLVELTFSVNAEFSQEQIAASIVHEGLHARVHRTGARVAAGAQPAREERICRRAELEFGRALPHGEAVVERALASLQLSDEEVAPAVDWAEAARRVEQVDRAAAEGA